MGSYPPEYFIQQSIRREACKSAAKSGLEKICANEVDKIQQDGITSCNTGIAVGGAVAAAGGIGLTILGFITAPVSVPMVVIGVVVFSSMAIGGGYVATVAGTQCKDEVQWNHDSNNRVCAEKVEEGVNRSCNF